MGGREREKNNERQAKLAEYHANLFVSCILYLSSVSKPIHLLTDTHRQPSSYLVDPRWSVAAWRRRCQRGVATAAAAAAEDTRPLPAPATWAMQPVAARRRRDAHSPG